MWHQGPPTSGAKTGENENRGAVDSNVTQQDLLDSYMAPFQDCVEQGKVFGLMCSYNAINGEPACANSWLLKDTARGEWGFDGYITSDCDAIGDGAMRQKYPDIAHASAASIKAGTDNDCGNTYGRPQGLRDAVEPVANIRGRRRCTFDDALEGAVASRTL